MRDLHLLVCSLVACATVGIATRPADRRTVSTAPVVTSPRVEFAKLPLAFERNDGQTDPSVRFVAHDRGSTLFVRPADAVIAFRDAAVAMRLVGAREDASVVATDELPGKANWFLGADPAGWHTEIPTFRRVECRGVWPGIDVAWHGTGGRLEYDFVVAPGADPDVIALEFDGADSVDIDRATGDLVVRVGPGELRQERPIVWQEEGDERRPVAGEFRLLGDRRVGFHVADRDPAHRLVIDPPLVYATYVAGGSHDMVSAIATNAEGEVFVCGTTASPFFPNVFGPYPASGPQRTESGWNGTLSKISATGTGLLYSTHFGGLGIDNARDVAIDADGNAFVCGTTSSFDFPTTPGALDRLVGDGSTTAPPTDGFVIKLDTRGSAVLYSTFLGGTGIDDLRGIAIDESGRAIVAGTSEGSLPADTYPTAGAFQRTRAGSGDAIVMWLDPAGSAVESMTWLGGLGYDFVTSLARDPSGDIVVTGGTASQSVAGISPLREHAGGGYDLFVAKLADAGHVRWFTYLGGSGSEPAFYADVDLDGEGNVLLASTSTSVDFPVSANAVQQTHGGENGYQSDAVVLRLTPDGTLDWATYLGGNDREYPVALAVDRESGNCVVVGGTESRDFPLVDAGQSQAAGDSDVFVAQFDATGTELVFSTRLAGEFDDWGEAVCTGPGGSIYVTGETYSLLVGPTTSFRIGVGSNRGGVPNGDPVVFVAKYAFADPVTPTLALVPKKGLIVHRTGNAWYHRGDKFSVSGTLRFLPGSPHGTFDPSTAAVTLTMGGREVPHSFVIPPVVGWTSKDGRHSWRTPRRSQVQVRLLIDVAKGTFSMSADGDGFSAPHTNPVLLGLSTADDAGFDERSWRRVGRNRLVLP